VPLSENVVANVFVTPSVEIGVWVNGPLTLPLAPVKRPVPPVIVVAVVPVEPPKPVPLPLKSPNSWSPFAAVRVREPASVKVLALVGVRTPSICTVVCPRWLTVPVPSVTKARVGANCYMLRCSFLHQGTTQHPQGSFTRIIFTEPKPQRNVFHMNVMDGALNISIREFCKDMAAAALAWQEAAEGTTTYQQTYSSDGKKFTPAYQALAGTLIERAKASRRADGKRRHRWRSKVGCPAPA
jgi:hypothetical protein